MFQSENEVLKLAAQWLHVRQWVLEDGPLPRGWDLAGAMLGMRDLEKEIELIHEEIRRK